MAETGWRRPFDDEIALPDGRVLRTLGDAGRYDVRPYRHAQGAARREAPGALHMIGYEVPALAS
jgi:hypothetical protein